MQHRQVVAGGLLVLYFTKPFKNFLLAFTLLITGAEFAHCQSESLAVYQGSDGPHIYYVDTNQHLNENGFHGANGWENFDITALAGSTTLAAPGTGVAVYQNSDGPHTYYVDANQHLNENGFHGTNGWENFDITALASSTTLAAPGTGVAVYSAADGPRIYYVDTNQHLNEIGFHGTNGWENFDITALAGSTTLAAPGTGVAVYSAADGPRVYYVDTNRCVNEIGFHGANGWENFNVTGLASSTTLAAPDTGVAVYLESDGPRVYYVDTNQCVNEIGFHGANGWENFNVTGLASSTTLAAPGTGVAVYRDSDGPRVYYVDTTQCLDEIGYHGSNGWESFNITALAGTNTLSLISSRISGQVIANGNRLPGVNLQLSGATAAGSSVLLSTTTNAQGTYSFAMPAGGDYTIVPSLSGYSFNPASNTFNDVKGDQVANFAASTGGGGTVPLPPPPVVCTNCGLNFVELSSGANPQATFAPNSTNTLYVSCQDVNTDEIIACNVSVSTTYIPQTNGHFHTNPPPPVSTISPTSGYTGNYDSFQMPVTITTTPVGQIESVIATDDDNGTVNSYDYAVGYLGLVYIDNSNIFYQVGGNTTNHGDNTWNHYMTVNAARGLQMAAVSYLNQYNPGQKVCINDMALPIGGKFDVCWSSAIGCKDKNGNPIVKPWDSPHISHDQGTAADVAAVARQCPPGYIVNMNLFLRACVNNGALAANSIPEGNHAHCRWPN